MSIEFVEPEESVAVAPAAGRAVAPVSAIPGRMLAAAAALAAVLAGVGVLLPLYAIDRTAFVIDFDGTSTQEARIPVDAFGHSAPVDLVTGQGAGGGPTSSLSVSVADGISYGPWWAGCAVVLLLVAVGAAVRPRSARPAAVVAAVGGLLLGSLGAAWLEIRTVAASSVPQIRFAADPALGLWALTAAGALALLGGLLAALRPPFRRLLPRRRV